MTTSLKECVAKVKELKTSVTAKDKDNDNRYIKTVKVGLEEADTIVRDTQSKLNASGSL